MKSGKIIVIGSSNMDMVVKTDHIPVPGETILSDSFFMNPGGKGANQAVAVSRLGGEVTFISKLGNDLFGKQFSQIFANEGIDTRYILLEENLHSGIALITVDKRGENSIVVASGANAHLERKDIDHALKEIDDAEIVLLQLEIPMDTVEYVVDYAHSRNIKVIVNPAPANILSSELLSKIDILTPNETEAGMISGIKVTDIESAKKAAKAIVDLGVKTVVITMGSLGALICDKGKFTMKEAKKVNPVDTTAAGDVFSGALAVALSEERNIEAAVEFACAAAGISVTRGGAQSSIPTRNEIES
jgi:ribokinase